MQSYHEDCVAIGIAEEMGDLVWSIAPNPAVNGTTTLIGLPSDVKWSVKDISGRIIQSGQGVDVHFSNCSEGIYFISTDRWGTQRVLIN